MNKCYFQIFPAGIGRKVVTIQGKTPFYIKLTTKLPSQKLPHNQIFHNFEFDSNMAYYNKDILKALTLLSMRYDSDTGRNNDELKVDLWLYLLFHSPEIYFNTIDKHLVVSYLDMIENNHLKLFKFLNIIVCLHRDYKLHYSSIHLLLMSFITTFASTKIPSKYWSYLFENLCGVDKNLLTKIVGVLNENFLNWKRDEDLKSQFLNQLVRYIYLRKDLASKWTQKQQGQVDLAVTDQLKLTETNLMTNESLVLKNLHTYIMFKKYTKQNLNETEFDQLKKLNGRFIRCSTENELLCEYADRVRRALNQFVTNLKRVTESKLPKLYMELIKLDRLVKKTSFEAIVDVSNLIFLYRKRFNIKYRNEGGDNNAIIHIQLKDFSKLLLEFINRRQLNDKPILVVLNRNSPIVSSGWELKKAVSEHTNCQIFGSSLLKDDVAMLYVAAQQCLKNNPYSKHHPKIYSYDQFSQYGTLVNPFFSQHFDDWISSITANSSQSELDRNLLLFFDPLKKLWYVKNGNEKNT